MHEFFKDPFEVGEGIEAVTAHLLNEGCRRPHLRQPASFLSIKHPVLYPELINPAINQAACLSFDEVK